MEAGFESLASQLIPNPTLEIISLALSSRQLYAVPPCRLRHQLEVTEDMLPAHRRSLQTGGGEVTVDAGCRAVRRMPHQPMRHLEG